MCVCIYIYIYIYIYIFLFYFCLHKFILKYIFFFREREQEPRFAHPGTFEYEFGLRWRQIEELEKERHDLVRKETEEARLKLEEEMQSALYEYQAEQIRQGTALSNKTFFIDLLHTLLYYWLIFTLFCHSVLI